MSDIELKIRREIKSFGIKYANVIGTILQVESDDHKIRLQELTQKYVKYQECVDEYIYLDWVFGELDHYFDIVIYPIPKIISIPINIPVKVNDEFLELARRGRVILNNSRSDDGEITYDYTIDKVIKEYDK